MNLKGKSFFWIILVALISGCSLFLSSEPLYKKSSRYRIKMSKEWSRYKLPEVDMAWSHRNDKYFFYVQSICNYYQDDSLKELIFELAQSYEPYEILDSSLTTFKGKTSYQLIIKHLDHVVLLQNFAHKNCYFDLNLTFKSASKQDTLREIQKIEKEYFSLK
jgi:hypothetical protein